MSAYQLTIDGKNAPAQKTFDVINPASEEVVAACPEADETLLDQAVVAATRAFTGWSALSFADQTIIRNKA